MPNNTARHRSRSVIEHKLAQELGELSKKVLYLANRNIPRHEFLKELSSILIKFTKADYLELRLREGNRFMRCGLNKSEKSFEFSVEDCFRDDSGIIMPCAISDTGVEKICKDVVLDRFDPSSPLFTESGSFLIGDLTNPNLMKSDLGDYLPENLGNGSGYRSFAMIRLSLGGEAIGILQLMSKKPYFFTEFEINFFCKDVAQTIGVAVVVQKAQADLHERIKELTCFYSIARIAGDREASLENILQAIVLLLPSAWQYPEIATAHICFDEKIYGLPFFDKVVSSQTAPIIIGDTTRGYVQVGYRERMPDIYEGPFLLEERQLLDSVAKELSLIIEQRQADEERSRLRDQLRHADRLATLGQLSAGIAHEINEPLANILGFAQLISKKENLPNDIANDIEKIVKATLHAREVVKKLMLFSRQMPTKKQAVDLNQIVRDGIYFLESRCIKEGVKLVRRLDNRLPKINADPSQMHQVLVNLIVNAIQAMPSGGKLILSTAHDQDSVYLSVEDTGIGMPDEILKKIFTPFFTTKDVGQGTGLGLAVVHGIVSGHGGSIDVESKVGKGSKFTVKLPIVNSEKTEE